MYPQMNPELQNRLYGRNQAIAQRNAIRRPNLSMATTPSGEQQMRALADRLRENLQRQNAQQQLNAVISNPAMPYESMGTGALDNPMFAPPEMEGAFGPIGTGPGFPGSMSDRQFAMQDRHNKIVAGGAGLPTYGQIMTGELDSPILGPYSGGYQSGFGNRPPVGAAASAGLDAGLAAQADLMDRNAQRGQEGWRLDQVAGMGVQPRVNPNPPRIGMPSPSAAARLSAERAAAMAEDPAVQERLQELMNGPEGIMSFVQGGDRGGVGALVNGPTRFRDHAAFNQMAEAGRANNALPPEQRIEVPGIRGQYSDVENGVTTLGGDPAIRQRQEWLANRNVDPRFQDYAKRQQEREAASLARRENRAEYLQAQRAGIDPSFVEARKLLMGGGGGGDGAGLNAAQMAGLGMMFPGAVPAMIQAQAAGQQGAADAGFRERQIALQEQMVQQQIAQQKQEQDAQFTPDHAGAVNRVRAKGGWANLTPEEKRMSALDTLKTHKNMITRVEKSGALEELGVSLEEFLAATGGKLPPMQGGMVNWGRGAEEARRKELFGSSAPAAPNRNAAPQVGGGIESIR